MFAPTMLPWLLACGGYGLEIRASNGVSTVANALWSGPDDARSRIVAKNGDGIRVVGDWQPPGGGGVPVVGLNADTTYEIFIESEGGEPGDPVVFTTGSLPPSLPDWSTTGSPGWRGFAVTSLMGGGNWAVVLDEAGKAVWYYELPNDGRLVRTRARRDGRGMWVVPASRDNKEDPSDLIGIDWNGNEIERHSIADFSHDYVEIEIGVIAFLLFDPREVGGRTEVGNRITEITLETGTSTDIFSTFDLWKTTEGEPGEDDDDWTAGNALDFDPETGLYTAGFRSLDAIIEVDRESGQVGRQFGGPDSDFDFANPQLAPNQQHQFQWSNDQILVFDNRENDEYSRVTEFSLDGQLANTVWTHQTDPPVWVYALGDVDRADDGSTFIDWAATGILEDVDPDGVTRWSLSAELGTAFGFLDRGNRLGELTRP